MARILILRDALASKLTARLVKAMGDTALILPTQEIRPLGLELPAGRFGGLIVTSVNAVPFVGDRFPARRPPVLAVGPATAHALRKAGAGPVILGEGTGTGLAEKALALFEESGLPLLYLAGRVRTEGLETALTERGVPFETLEVYDTVQVEPDQESIAAVIGEGSTDAVLLLSVGQAESFLRLLSTSPGRFDPPPIALCLSERIARALPLSLRDAALVANRPELSELLRHYHEARPV